LSNQIKFKNANSAMTLAGQDYVRLISGFFHVNISLIYNKVRTFASGEYYGYYYS
ncbi:hypothetical protein SAMN05216326_1011, partial [Nitrosomonas marina]